MVLNDFMYPMCPVDFPKDVNAIIPCRRFIECQTGQRERCASTYNQRNSEANSRQIGMRTVLCAEKPSKPRLLPSRIANYLFIPIWYFLEIHYFSKVGLL
ncbi:hypothetical protein CDAR_491671 [Caerostris darwini]|uniref:Uncharacterized protein n=1 Tax=Caerostris darwini TaxID=1538125 RepID=A0AAV4N234_9ARAC|nr:hypothetical protein CDAR_491671 [Caerostris darwini]